MNLLIVQENLEFLKSSLELSGLDQAVMTFIKCVENEQKLSNVSKLVFFEGFLNIFDQLLAWIPDFSNSLRGHVGFSCQNEHPVVLYSEIFRSSFTCRHSWLLLWQQLGLLLGSCTLSAYFQLIAKVIAISNLVVWKVLLRGTVLKEKGHTCNNFFIVITVSRSWHDPPGRVEAGFSMQTYFLVAREPSECEWWYRLAVQEEVLRTNVAVRFYADFVPVANFFVGCKARWFCALNDVYWSCNCTYWLQSRCNHVCLGTWIDAVTHIADQNAVCETVLEQYAVVKFKGAALTIGMWHLLSALGKLLLGAIDDKFVVVLLGHIVLEFSVMGFPILLPVAHAGLEVVAWTSW